MLKKFATLFAVTAAAFCTSALASNFTGTTVNWQYYAYGGVYNLNQDNGTSSGTFVMTCSDCGNFDGYFTIETGANYIQFDYSVCGTTGLCPNAWSDSQLSLAPKIYNGIDLLLSGGPTITSVSVDSATNMAGFDSSYIYFTGSEIQVDWHKLPFDSSTIVRLDLNGTTTTPEPGTLMLLGIGMVAAAMARRRKITNK